MKKKLYKAKKNWVIGIIAGAVLLFGGNAVVSADTDITVNTIATTSDVAVARQNSTTQQPAAVPTENKTNDQVSVSYAEQQTQWDQSKDQQLDNYMTSYGQQHGMVFQKYDGSTPMPIDGDYPAFDITKVHSDQNATVGFSKDGTNQYDYNAVAIYNHYSDNTLSQFHDTYWFTLHNNQPVVLEDSTTNGGTIWLNNTNEVREWDPAIADNINVFQAAFAQIINNEPVYDAADHGNYASLDQHTLDNNGQLHISGWHATNGALGKDYRYIILLNGQTHQEIARKNITNLTIKREDVAKVHNLYRADQSGFDVNFDLSNVIATTPSLQIVDRYTNDPEGNGQSVDYWFTPFVINHNNYGSLDSVKVENNQLKVNGWHASNLAANKKYHYVILLDNTDGNREIGRQEVKTVISRPDVAAAFPDVYNAGDSGFAAVFALSSSVNLNHRFQVVDRYTDDPAGNGDAVDYWFNPFGEGYSNQAYLDSFNPTDGATLKVNGWHANDVSTLEKNHFIILFDNTTKKQVAATKAISVSRPDVARAYPNVKTAGQSGFQAEFNLKNLQLIPGNSYSVVSRYSTSDQGNGDQGAYTDYWLNPVQLNQKASHIDNIQMTNNGLQVSGWLVDDAALTRSEPYIIILNDGKEVARQKLTLLSRPDVARVYPNAYNSANSGFQTLVKLDPQVVNGNMQVLLRFTDDLAGNGNYSDQYSEKYVLNAGSFDQIKVSADSIYISGWHATNQSAAMPYQYLIALGENGQELYRWQVPDNKRARNDVAAAYPTILNSGKSGYQLGFNIPSQVQHHTVRFIHRYSDDPAGNGHFVDVYSNPVNVNNIMRNPIDYRQPSEYLPYPNVSQHQNFWIHVKIGQNRVYLMDGNNTLYTMYCSAGVYRNGVSATPTGTYYVQAERGNSFYNGSVGVGANYWTSFLNHGEYLFHTVPTDAHGNYISYEASKLGITQGSHGCIRLSIPDAYWIMHNVPTGTRVMIEN